MNLRRTDRGFEVLSHPRYPEGVERLSGTDRLAQQSSSVGNYDDALYRPGSSALWIGEDHLLNREEVAELVVYLQRWLDTGKLGVSAPKSED